MKRLLICLMLLLTVPVVSSYANQASTLYTGNELLTEFLEAKDLDSLKARVDRFLKTHKDCHIVDMDYSVGVGTSQYNSHYVYSVMIVYVKK